jgi:peptidyl-prolyl cis-trans isomerase C
MNVLSRKRQLATMLWLLLILIGAPWAQPVSGADQAVATVNTAKILQSDLTSEIQQLKMEMDFRNRSLNDQQAAALRNQVLETLIERELLYQRAQQRDLQVRSRWVDKALDELKLHLKSNGVSLKDYLSFVGLTDKQLQERIRKGLIVQRLLRRDVIRKIKISEAEMKSFYEKHPEYFKREEQVRARHILISVPNNADADKRNQAMLQIQSLALQLQKGADFGVLALEYSQCPSKARGGDLGYFTRDQMIHAFSEAAFQLQPGEISDVVTTVYGLHLIQVLDRRPASQMAYRHTRDKIERTLRRDKEQAAARTYLSRLKKQATIARHLN